MQRMHSGLKDGSSGESERGYIGSCKLIYISDEQIREVLVWQNTSALWRMYMSIRKEKKEITVAS